MRIVRAGPRSYQAHTQRSDLVKIWKFSTASNDNAHTTWLSLQSSHAVIGIRKIQNSSIICYIKPIIPLILNKSALSCDWSDGGDRGQDSRRGRRLNPCCSITRVIKVILSPGDITNIQIAGRDDDNCTAGAIFGSVTNSGQGKTFLKLTFVFMRSGGWSHHWTWACQLWGDYPIHISIYHHVSPSNILYILRKRHLNHFLNNKEK